jgi:hypothetical protein
MKNQNMIIGAGLSEKITVMGNAIPTQFQNNPVGTGVVIANVLPVGR